MTGRHAQQVAVVAPGSVEDGPWIASELPNAVGQRLLWWS